MKSFLPILSLFLAAAHTASAGILLRPADELTLLSEADAVVFAEVTATRAEFRPHGIETVVSIDPIEVFRGQISGPLDLREPGGVVGTFGQFISYAPVWRTGEHALLFLKRDGQHLRTVRLGFGKFNWVPAEKGARLERHVGSLEASSHDAERLLSTIRHRTGSRLLASYPKATSATVVAQQQPSEFLINVCVNNTCLPSRVAAFDRGAPFHYVITGDQPGFDADAGVLAAANAWESHAASRIDFSLSQGFGSGFTSDGQNTIELNSAYVREEGFLSLAWFWVNGAHQFRGESFFTIVENDHGIAQGVPESQSEFEQGLTLNFGVGIGFLQPDPLTLDPNESVLSPEVDGGLGANLGPYDRMVAATVYPASLQQLPEIHTFSATPQRIRRGQTSLLTWSTNATSVQIAPGLGSHPPTGTLEVTPQQTTTYTLTAIGSGGNSEATATVEVLTEPLVSVEAIPDVIFQPSGTPGATARYALRNIGGSPTTIELGQSGSFFTQSPSSFTLQPGERQPVEITGLDVPAGAYAGASLPTGDGVPPNLRVPLRMLVSTPPTGSTSARAQQSRVDVHGSGDTATASASFTNTGDARIEGILTSNVPWIIPQEGLITIAPGETATVEYTIDRRLRQDGGVSAGSAIGTLSLVFPGTSAAKGLSLHDGTTTTTTLVTVVDTKTPATTIAGVPALAAGEVAWFLPGVGHVVGSVGTFVSDIAMTNLGAGAPIPSLDLYYTAIGASSAQAVKATVSNLATTTPLTLADVVRTVYDENAQIGSLQVRGAAPDALSLNANIFVASKPEGTFGTTIPTMRSDRSRGPGESIFLTGLRKTDTSHTNIYIQEMAGATVTVEMSFLGADGAELGTRNETIGPWQLLQIGNPLPLGAVSAVLRSANESTGRFSGYATPVDRASGDTWAVADWAAELGYEANEAMLIPVGGSVVGANETFFRTDLSIFNRGPAEATGTLHYYPRGGEAAQTTLTFGPKQTMVFDDVSTKLFGADGTLGFFTFIPDNGEFSVTSRTFTTVAGGVATFGSGTPTATLASSLEVGESLRIGSIEDSARVSIRGEQGGSFRSNLGLLETKGETVTVRATLYFSFAAGTTASGRGVGTRDFTLGPHDFLLLSRISQQILGEARDTIGDLNNLQADFTVIGGDGAASVWISSVDNGTGDSLLRTE